MGALGKGNAKGQSRLRIGVLKQSRKRLSQP
jgi:hypothetical protein